MSKEVKVTVDKKKIDSLIGNAQLALLEIEKNAEILSEMGFNIKIDVDCNPAIKKIVKQTIKSES